MKVQVEEALAGKNVRLARIDVQYEHKASESKGLEVLKKRKLKELQPEEVFGKVLSDKVAEESEQNRLMELFRTVVQTVNEQENV
jgi:exonuclease SbcD